MNTANAYFTDLSQVVLPKVKEEPLSFGRRTRVLIPDKKAIVDIETGHAFNVVSEGYKLIPHEEVLQKMEQICEEHKEWGTPSWEIWLSEFGGRMKVRVTFRELLFEIAPGDEVNPTMEAFASYDGSLAQMLSIGGFRLVCTNGMMIGNILAKYKWKHTIGLDMERAGAIISSGMEKYSKAVGLWKSFTKRTALEEEVFLYEAVPFHKEERERVENNIKNIGKVLSWDNNDKENRKVEINAWDLYNIFTDEASHNVSDITRREKVLATVASTFK